MLSQSAEKLRYVPHISEGFRRARPTKTVDEMIDRCVLLQEWLVQQVKLSSSHRHVRVELLYHTLQYPFGEKPVIGILAILNTLEEYELFRESHMTSAVLDAYPAAQVIDRSFLSFSMTHSPLHLVYLEIISPATKEESLLCLL